MPEYTLLLPDKDSPDGVSQATLEEIAAAKGLTLGEYINRTLAFNCGFLPAYPDIPTTGPKPFQALQDLLSQK